ncbi:MAG: right-handed parallel beta-helix repeat-containing protein [Candidatus Coatesbacteria bacterium]|nr:right-handed parallel beta-helix repeat-containing protein [Candidatus Coatesbacteria bacterium]
MHRADRQFVLTSIYVICTLIITFAAMFANAAEYYVSTSGNDGNSGLSSGDAWRTITWAMAHVPTDGTYESPHIVHVAPGTYTYTDGGPNDETFPIHWRHGQSTPLNYVHLVGDDVETTIIDYGNWADSGEYEEGILEAWIENVHIEGVTIATLTIRNGVAAEANGGQIYINNAQAHITGCVIEYGWGALYGGGIYAEDAELTVTDCTLQHNTSMYGGGIACNSADVQIKDSRFYNNEAFYNDDPQIRDGGSGGGIYMELCPDTCLVRDCYILENLADLSFGYGGGIYLKDSSPHIAHNQIRATVANYHTGPGNQANCGAGIYMTDNSDPLIDEWNKIAENHAAMNGGGLYANLGSSTPQIEGNEFFWNKALDGNGGGLFSRKANLVVRSNYITANEAHGLASESKGSGGGIYCEEGSGSVHSIYDINWVSANQADTAGGGICFLNGVANSSLRNNNIWTNRAGDGDGVYLGQSNELSLQDNGIWDNGTPNNPGEGIRVDGGTATLFNNLVFSSNSNSNQAIGVYASGSMLTIRNLTIAHHSDYGIYADSGSVWIWDSIIWGNATSITGSATVEVFYTDIQGGWGGTGSNNIDQDPLFVPLGGARGWPLGYFLSQEAAGQAPPDSPCVDTGSAAASSIFTGSDYPVIPCTRTDAVSDADRVDMGYHYVRNGATYIELNSFEAKGLNGRVLVTWTTGTEIDNAGFDIYRKEEGSTDFAKVNGSLIPAQGTLGGGASYSFVDTNVVAQTKYLYYLVDVDANGKTTAHGPVSATPYSIGVPSLHRGDGVVRDNAAPNMTKLTAK